jgi:5-keto-L-gluconate epimerase
MKYGIVISAEETKFGDIILKGSLEENIRKAAEIGYDGVELALKNPANIDMTALSQQLDSYTLEVPVIGTGQIFVDEGLSFADSDSGKRKAAINKVCEIAEMARKFNSAVIIGLVRGVLPQGASQYEKEVAIYQIQESVTACAAFSEKWSGKFLLEPMHRYHTSLINTLDEAADFIKGNDPLYRSGRIGILADTWHMNIEETDLISPVIKNKDLIAHIHLADSNRRAPGYGHLNFKEFCNCLCELGYTGYGSFEALPWPTVDICAVEALQFMKMIDTQIGHQGAYSKVVTA